MPERILFVDQDGNGSGVQIYNEKLFTLSQTYLQAISEGYITNHVPWSKIGYSPASTAAETLVWAPGTDYTWPTAKMQMEVVSASADDAAAGTGARTVLISYLDDTLTEKTETVTLNGVTPVLTVATDIYRINDFRVMTAGTGLKAAGAISLRHVDDTPIYEQIAAGGTASRTIIYTVPKGKTLFVTGLYFSAGANAGGKRVTFTTRGTYNPATGAINAGGIFYPYTETSVVDQAITLSLEIPSKFPEGTRLKVNVQGEVGAVCTAQARGWLEVAD